MKKIQTYSLFPSIARGNGSGHLMRCCDLAEALGPGAKLYLPEAGLPGFYTREQVHALAGSREGVKRIEFFMPEEPGISILDRRATEESLYRRLARLGPVIALDEDGIARTCASCILDTLPRLKGPEANISSPEFLDLPEKGGRPVEKRGVLVTFGGEDPAGLTEVLVPSLVPSFFSPAEVTVLRPALSGRLSLPDGVGLLEPLPGLKHRLAEYSLVFCSFGLTAYEACAAGTPVVLFNPSRYHRALSRAAGFPEIGIMRPRTGRLRNLLSDPGALEKACRKVVPDQRRSAVSLVSGLSFSGPRGCPVCGSAENPAVARFEDATYFRCPGCGIVYQENFSPRDNPYEKNYFFEEYRKQYGKTYLEDFDTIRQASAGRAAEIRRLLSPRKERPRLLDVGCAYGPFLAAAAAAGFDPRGLDVVPEAVAHVSGTLGFPAFVSSFEDCLPRQYGGGTFDALTMWYVIEHFDNLDRVLRKVSRMLSPGGVFAFSTPNLHGVSARRSLQAFLEASPADHRTIFSPPSVGKILRNYGLSLERIRITGHHPERFPPGPAPLYNGISRLFGLGDTFEAYAVKTGDP